MSLKELKTKIDALQTTVKEFEKQIILLSAEIDAIEKTITQKKRKKLHIDPAVLSACQSKKAKLAEAKTNLNNAIQSFIALSEDFKTLTDPASALPEFSNRTPFFLFPVRLETRYRDLDAILPKTPKLMVRIYPDTLAVDTFEEQFSNDEVKKAEWYFHEIDRIATEVIGSEAVTTIPESEHVRLRNDVETEFASAIAGLSDDNAKERFIEARVLEKWTPMLKHKRNVLAWSELVSSVGRGRAAYIIAKGKMFFSSVTASAKKRDSWVKAPQCHVMPDFFVIRLYTKQIVNDKIVHQFYKDVRGNLIPNPLRVGPDPSSIGSNSTTFFDDNSAWMHDFQKAVDTGMAVEIDLAGLTSRQINAGFSRVIAIGLRMDYSENNTATNVENGSEYILKQWIDHHHYSDGFSIVKQGTPTNNTESTSSAFSTDEKNCEESFAVECGDASVATGETMKDGHRFLAALGLEADTSPVSHVSSAGETDCEDARVMAIALWPVTWKYYLSLFVKKGNPYPLYEESVRSHFVEYVRARGPYPAFRTGNVPYGILPVSSIECWVIEEQADGNDYESDFLSSLVQLSRKLFEYWKILAEDVDKIPRVGATDDPDKELVGVLGMQASSLSYRMRNIVTEDYLKNLLAYVWPTLFQAEDIVSKVIQTVKQLLQKSTQPSNPVESVNSLQSFLESCDKTKAESIALLRDFTGSSFDFSPAKLAAWGNGFDLDLPLVQDGRSSETKPLADNYIRRLYESTFDDIPGLQCAGKTPILFILLREVILSCKDSFTNPTNQLSTYTNVDIVKSLACLEGLSSAKLERLLSETLDLSAHRLDAWITSLATRRLELLRTGGKNTYIGAYGWIEDLVPAGERKSGGYVHAPSPTHAITAAVLRNAYLTHADAANAERMSVNLSSGRVKKALWLLGGIREGLPLGVLLGYRFERSLHELVGEKLDRYILPFRNCFPLVIGKETEASPDEAIENLAPRNVVDGDALLKAYKSKTIPFGKKGLPPSNSRAYKAIVPVLDDLDENFDAVSDLLLAESVHQAVLGNYIASGAALNAASADGSPPDEILVAKIPRGGIDVKHNALVLFGDTVTPPSVWPCDTPRAYASPALNAWFGRMLGDPRRIVGYADYPDDDANAYVKVEFNLLGIRDPDRPGNVFDANRLGFSPIDFVYLSGTAGKSEGTEFENRIMYCIKRQFGLPRDCEIRLSFERNSRTAADETSIGEILPFARAMFALVTSSPFLIPEDLCLPEETADGPTTTDDNRFRGFVESDYVYLRGKDTDNPLPTHTLAYAKKRLSDLASGISGVLATIPLATDTLDAGRIAAFVGNLRPYMENLHEYGVPVNIPQSAIETDREAFDEIVDASSRALVRIEERFDSCVPILAEADALAKGISNTAPYNTQNDTWKKVMDLIARCFKELFGKSFIVLPSFTPSNAIELSVGFTPAHSAVLLAGNGKQRVRNWFGQAAQTHPALRRLETLLAFDGMHNRSFNDVRIGQLPFSENDRWIALEWPSDATRMYKESKQGTLSLVVYSEDAIDYGKRIRGLMLDRWDEMIPHDDEVTSVSYQYDRPGNEAPNVCLLCVSPELAPAGNTIGWKWEHLVKTIEETIDLAKVRTVDGDAIKKLGSFLPAIYLPAEVDPDAHRIRVPFQTIQMP